MTSALQMNGDRRHEYALSAEEVTVVAAICNRLARTLGTLDREGVYEDIEIVQTQCPINLAALLAAPDRAFIEEMSMILEAADRRTRSLRGQFRSRFEIDRRSR